jgi:hypothetical protein
MQTLSTSPVKATPAAAATEAPDGSYTIVAPTTFDPTGPNMLHVQQGDTVQVLERHNTGWCYCKNQATGSTGWCPSWAVQGVQAPAGNAGGNAPSTPVSSKSAIGPVATEIQQTLKELPRSPQQKPVMQAPSSPISPAPAQQQAPQTVVRVATSPFAASGLSQLQLAPNDLVEIVERHSTGWTYGKKVCQSMDGSVSLEGWFPDWVCAPK